jgi:pimeloyl-ACP methyl ester carboxylesterase
MAPSYRATVGVVTPVFPDPIVATPGNLPPAVAAALERADTDPDPGERTTTIAAGIPFSSIAWGVSTGRPLLLIHGVTASARIWWRIGPALATTGRRVVALDLPGHGLTGHWQGRHRFADNAVDVAAWIRAAGLDVPGLQIVGHSWGAMTAAALPRAGILPATLVLLDPPAIPHEIIAAMAIDPSEVAYPDLATAIAALAAANPAWSQGDVLAKAEALTQLQVEAARAVLVDNGDWDGGLADLSDPAADGIPVWIVRGDPTTGGLIPDEATPALAARVRADHVLTLAGAPHAPQRTHPVATTVALLRALTDDG